MKHIIDISLPIHAGMPTYPGTAPTRMTEVPSASGTSILTEFAMTTHAGTHVDAPNHALVNDKGVDAFPLDVFYGQCRVLDPSGVGEAITESSLRLYDIQAGERILLRTHNSVRGFTDFYDDYVYIDNDAARYLGSIGIALVGIDSLSVKQRGLNDNTAHTALLEQDIPIIEGLDLSRVEEGAYTLAAFPMAFIGTDGAPVRAVLLPSSE